MYRYVDALSLSLYIYIHKQLEGGYNVSYYTPRAYSHIFEDLKGENVSSLMPRSE